MPQSVSYTHLDVYKRQGMYFPAGDTGAPSHRQENRSVSHCCIGVVVCRDPAVRRLGDHQGTVGICADLRDVS